MTQWLLHMQQLTGLEHLDVSFEVDWPPPSPAFAGLTASSKLKTIELVGPGTHLPSGVWQHVFGAKALPCVERVHISTAFEATSEVSSLVSCCPALQHCDLSLQPGVAVAPLVQLTGLTYLDVGHTTVDTSSFDSNIQSLAAMTNLRELDISFPALVQPSSMVALTALTRLKHLGCRNTEPHPKTTKGHDVYLWSRVRHLMLRTALFVLMPVFLGQQQPLSIVDNVSNTYCPGLDQMVPAVPYIQLSLTRMHGVCNHC